MNNEYYVTESKDGFCVKLNFKEVIGGVETKQDALFIAMHLNMLKESSDQEVRNVLAVL